MSWRPQYRSSKFRNVYGKAANREHCFDGIPITKNVHDNHFCAVNARFLAIVTESAGGGSFLVIPLEQVSGPASTVTSCLASHCTLWEFLIYLLQKILAHPSPWQYPITVGIFGELNLVVNKIGSGKD